MRSDWIDDAVQRRLTEIMSAAGVDHSRASLEVLYMLPREFLTRYMELFDKALKFADGNAGERGEEAKSKGGTGRDRGKLPMLGAGGKRYKEHWIVRNDDALALKSRIDKRLRALGREIMSESEDGNGREGRINCARCGRIMRGDWNFCANCGNHRPHGE